MRLRRLIGDVDLDKYEECFEYLDYEHAGADEYRIETIRELLDIKRWLAEKNPRFSIKLADSLERFGNLLWVRHEEEQAVDVFAQAVSVRRELASDLESRILLAKSLADYGIGLWWRLGGEPAVGTLRRRARSGSRWLTRSPTTGPVPSARSRSTPWRCG
ncbi:hypothetical protein GCM10029992_42520 [Glycomyces albus]